MPGVLVRHGNRGPPSCSTAVPWTRGGPNSHHREHDRFAASARLLGRRKAGAGSNMASLDFSLENHSPCEQDFI